MTTTTKAGRASVTDALRRVCELHRAAFTAEARGPRDVTVRAHASDGTFAMICLGPRDGGVACIHWVTAGSRRFRAAFTGSVNRYHYGKATSCVEIDRLGVELARGLALIQSGEAYQ